MPAEFTKGPWKVAGPSKTVGRFVWRNDPEPNPRNDGYAQICRNVRSEADARLISASPDLLEACKGAAILLNTALKEYDSEPWAQRLRAAILKAEGSR